MEKLHARALIEAEAYYLALDYMRNIIHFIPDVLGEGFKG